MTASLGNCVSTFIGGPNHRHVKGLGGAGVFACPECNQKNSFAPNWMLRLPLAAVMLPNDDVPNVVPVFAPGPGAPPPGLAKLVWLKNANDSKRNWNFNRSLIGKLEVAVGADIRY